MKIALATLHRRELKLLLGAEVGEEPALAHAHGICEAADREPADALDRGQLGGLLQDRVATALAVAAALARRALGRSLDSSRHSFLDKLARPVV